MRRSQYDNGSQPVRNLFPNPGAEQAGSTITVSVNKTQNPGMEAPGTTVAVRTNYCENPAPTVTTGWAGPLPEITTFSDGNPAYKAVANGTQTPYVFTGRGTAAVAVGETWTLSADIEVDAASLIGRLDIRAHKRVGNTYYTSGQNLNYDPRGKGKHRVSVTFVASEEIPASDLDLSFVFYQAGGTLLPAGEWLKVGNVLIEKAGAALPYFSGSQPAHRNLASDPRALTFTGTVGVGWRNSRWFGGNSTPAGTYTNVTATDGPTPELTTYARKRWTSSNLGTTNGDTGFDLAAGFNTAAGVSYQGGWTVTAGMTYTLSAWLRATSDKASVQFDMTWRDADGYYISRTATPYNTLTAGQWTRIVATVKAPANAVTAGLVLDTDGGSLWQAGETLDGTGLIVEAASTASPFFYEGLGDYTYDWTGTANAGSSQQYATRVSGRTGLSSTVAWQSTARARLGTKSAAVLCTMPVSSTMTIWYPVNDAEYATGTGTNLLLPNTTYTWSAYVWVPAGGGAVSLCEAGTSTYGAASTLQDQWERISVTFTTPASGNVIMRLRGVTGTTIPAGTIIWVDNEQMIQGPTPLPYYDGGTAAAGDFTYGWAGASNASESRQYATGLPIFGGGSQSATVQSSEWAASGSKSVRIVPNTASSDSFAYISMPKLPNGTYTILGTLRIPATHGGVANPRTRALAAFHSGRVDYAPSAPSAPGVYPMRLTFTVTDSAAYQSFRAYNGATAGNGDVWWDRLMVVEGAYQGDYINPDINALAKWDGTPNASMSVGYHQTLGEIAGAPAVDITGVGDTGSVAVDPYAARTFYFVYESTDINAGSWQVPWYYGIPASAGLTLQTNTAGNDSMAPRLDFPNGTINRTFTGVTRGTARRNVVAITLAQGLPQAVVSNAGGGDYAVTYASPGDGWANGRFWSVNRLGISPVRGLLYYAEHDRAARVAISRYLGNKYGANVA